MQCVHGCDGLRPAGTSAGDDERERRRREGAVPRRAADRGRRHPVVGSPGQKWDIDHIIPLAMSGEDSPSNLQVLCKICHKYKTDQSIDDQFIDINDLAKLQADIQKGLT